MKKFLAVAVVAGLLGGVFAWNTDPARAVSGTLKGADVPAGATLRYAVQFFGVLPVGTAEFKAPREQTYAGSPAYHLEARAASAGVAGALYKASCVLDSLDDAKTLSPYRFKETIAQQGKPAAVKEVTYDQAAGTMTMEGVSRTVPPKTLDPLAVMLNLARMDFGTTKEFDLNLNTNHKNYACKGTVKDSPIVVRGKTYPAATVSMQIFRRDKNPYHKSQLTIVYLRGRENVPVLIKVFASGAFINARLVELR